jgi:hypothetical protein
MYQITEEQLDALKGFKLHIWTHYHEKESHFDHSFWAQMLDDLKIPWFVQNTTAILMETRANGFSSLKALLQKEGILVS